MVEEHVRRHDAEQAVATHAQPASVGAARGAAGARDSPDMLRRHVPAGGERVWERRAHVVLWPCIKGVTRARAIAIGDGGPSSATLDNSREKRKGEGVWAAHLARDTAAARGCRSRTPSTARPPVFPRVGRRRGARAARARRGSPTPPRRRPRAPSGARARPGWCACQRGGKGGGARVTPARTANTHGFLMVRDEHGVCVPGVRAGRGVRERGSEGVDVLLAVAARVDVVWRDWRRSHGRCS